MTGDTRPPDDASTDRDASGTGPFTPATGLGVVLGSPAAGRHRRPDPEPPEAPTPPPPVAHEPREPDPLPVRSTPPTSAPAVAHPAPHPTTPPTDDFPTVTAPELLPEDTALPRTSPVAPELPPVSRRVEFAPRRALRRLLAALVLISLLAAAATSWMAWRTGVESDVVMAGIMAALAFVLASIRATIKPIRLVIDGGQLFVSQGHLQEIHDLTSRYTDVRVEGDPSSRSWAVVITRYDAPTRRITHDVVDGEAFVRVLRYWRPDDLPA